MRFVLHLLHAFGDFFGLVTDDDLSDDPLLTEPNSSSDAVAAEQPKGAPPTNAVTDSGQISTHALVIVRAGETYADYAARARRAERDALSFAEWVESAELDDEVWRTQRDRIAQAVEELFDRA